MATAMALLRLAALAGAVALLLLGSAEARILLSLDDFGAVGDGIADDTQALVDAWKAACANTNGHVVIHVPAGRSYQIWPVTLAGPCRDEIMLFVSGNIIAPESLEDWERSDGGKWLHFYQVQDLTVSGGGVIDGRGQEWWAQSCKRKHHNDKHCTAQDAPKALHFEECHGVRVQGVTLQNGQQHHLTFTRCSNARASFLRVVSPESSPDTNGIHLVNSISVHVTDIHIATGGACVSMVGNCKDVRLRYISCGPGNGISIGSIGETPVSDRLEKIEVDTMFIANTTNGLLIKTWQDGCGYARKVKFANVVMKNVSDPIIIDEDGGGGEDRLREHRRHVGVKAGGDLLVQRRRAVQAGVSQGREPEAAQRARRLRLLPQRVREGRRRRRPGVLPRRSQGCWRRGGVSCVRSRQGSWSHCDAPACREWRQ